MANKDSSPKIKTEAEALTTDLLNLLGVKAKVAVGVEEPAVTIKIDGEDLGLLIGYRGENLETLQLILSIALNKKLGFDSRRLVLVDVGGWRAQREEALRAYIEKEIIKISVEEPLIKLSPMPPSERRLVHFMVKEHEGLISESEGEEPNRYVLIRKEGED